MEALPDPPDRADPAPSLVVVCGGEHCVLTAGAATGGADVAGQVVERLRPVVAACPHGVLVRTGCLLRCADRHRRDGVRPARGVRVGVQVPGRTSTRVRWCLAGTERPVAGIASWVGHELERRTR